MYCFLPTPSEEREQRKRVSGWEGEEGDQDQDSSFLERARTTRLTVRLGVPDFELEERLGSGVHLIELVANQRWRGEERRREGREGRLVSSELISTGWNGRDEVVAREARQKGFRLEEDGNVCIPFTLPVVLLEQRGSRTH